MNQPAFPFVAEDETGMMLNMGMDLRDYFATRAMSEMFDGGWIHSGEIEEVDLNHLAKWSFKMADAMMEARKNDS
jgi:hypothetical protein